MRGRTKVLLVDDHPIVRQGIRAFLARHANLVIVGEAADGVEAVAKAKALLPDLVLLDIELPQMSGLAVAEVVHKELPNSKVLMLSSQRAEYLPHIVQSGARGYVLKEAPLEELVEAIETVITGECYFSPEIARLALKEYLRRNGERRGLECLTGQERKVLALVAQGLSNKEVACKLNVSVRTVETHRERIMRKLGIHSVAGLTRFAVAEGLIKLQDEARR